ncbi:UDP-N-acetylmuramoylalanine/D-glutamate ligase [Chloroherpeton thalassium ATCC 35110]|uniref:UDP-N-acetylmuramoylalanine--D-glutamate ligase n=1 Tax=Chloroherpeton thalassium (strain ATCC 35110 / GB-78) TaxID=517418 RepID=MURD_CHLT3|nr:UDP-N-acetylmuramoyl-L-alanine--D-glutamate ligase [Chloroherpeton thalassium]B3QWT5.1 RecName: Full=UDP-N-acetylmuramoylalanine--D-glutamate ligase; AltName: Full=D-glutamic acid-adding enzyme; AltName: Full=UDP-N-acetylmuramoyl-L-alanyl-D-glutamate synthetase [Chloroherpeton thalassium ATCC 35110]ACF13299.1 UDP-N-acetylmuramoylalanine/D-glutamate ligase [Chloroherpeton thalassium ATCC 35110]
MTHEEIKGKRCAIIGGKRSGIAAAKLLSRAGAYVFLSEKSVPENQATLESDLRAHGIECEFGQHSEEVFDADFAIISPGVPSSAPVIKQLERAQVPVYSEIELASWFCKAKIIAITGTDGKTTVTTLTKKIFEADGNENGYHAYALGNIGQPFSDTVESLSENDVAVIEISSFQLEHCTSFRPNVTVITNITPDHLDRYDGNIQKYAAAKYRIYQNQTASDWLIYNDDNEILHQHFTDPERRASLPMKLVALSLEKNLGDEYEHCAYKENGRLVLKLTNEKEWLIEENQISTKQFRGQHNIYNALTAAAAASALGIDKKFIEKSILSFEGVEHRLEFVRAVNQVDYINDSKATTVNALWYALDTVTPKIVLIAGGRDKGNDYTKVFSFVKEKVRAVVAIGESQEKVVQAFGNLTKVMKAFSLDEAVRLASQEAEAGDTVLLSPACASFDMFSNFETRGKLFKEAVMNL